MNPTNPIATLRNRIIGAGSWVFGGYVVSQTFRLGGNLVMTRLLVPEMFGVMAVANIFFMGLELFSDIGLRQNVIQSKHGENPEFLNTVWTVQIVRGILIWIAAIGLAIACHLMSLNHVWPANSVYSEPILPYVISVLTFSAVISGFNSTKLATENRNINLGAITRIELLSQLSGLILMIAWAMVDRSIWSLVAGSILSSSVKMFLSHLAVPGLSNRIQWDTKSFREIFGFGKWVFLASILGFLSINGDRIILGGLVDATILGVYAIAFFIVASIENLFTKIFGAVIFPALSEIARDRPTELLNIYYKVRLPVDVASLFGAGVLFMTGHFLIEILYDERYLQAGYMVEILSISLFTVRYNLASQCFLALGKPNLLVPIIVARIAILFLLMPVVFSKFGLHGALWVIGVSRLGALPVIFYLKSKYKILNMSREYYAILFFATGILVGWTISRMLVPG